VIYMGLSTFGRIAEKLIANGRSADTPAAAVRWATRADQEVVVGTLASLARLIQEHGMKPPATIVVGDVVRLRDRLSWFEELPLFGQRIVVTRPAGQSAGLTSALRDLGADVVELPAIEIIAPEDSQPIERAVRELSDYQWLIFTSANGVEGSATRWTLRRRTGAICEARLPSLARRLARRWRRSISRST
jgi:uroporphyrinogen III methyltransferase/synthase